MMQDTIKELLKQDNARIRWVDYGVANSFCYNYKDRAYKVIEINKDILDEQGLLMPILMHELRHSKKMFSQEDIVNDFSMANLKSLPNFKILKFMATHPRAMVQALPVYKTSKQGLVFDLNLIGIYALGLLVLAGILIFLA